MARLFGREARVTISAEGETFSVENNRIAFRADKFAGVWNSAAVITIYNLREAERNVLARRVPTRETIMVKPRIEALLYAGYAGEPLPLISRGAGLKVDSVNSRRGPDWVSELQIFSTLDQDVNTRHEQSWTKTSALTIVKILFSEWLYPNPIITPTAEAVLSAAVIDYVASGPVKRSIDTLLRRLNLAFNVDDDGAFIVVDGAAADVDQPDAGLPLISEQSGMIGTPRITRTGVVVRTLLDARIKPLRSFVVESATVTATLNVHRQRYTALEVQHIGDTRGDDWFTEVTGAYPAFVREGIDVAAEPRGPVQ